MREGANQKNKNWMNQTSEKKKTLVRSKSMLFFLLYKHNYNSLLFHVFSQLTCFPSFPYVCQHRWISIQEPFPVPCTHIHASCYGQGLIIFLPHFSDPRWWKTHRTTDSGLSVCSLYCPPVLHWVNVLCRKMSGRLSGQFAFTELTFLSGWLEWSVNFTGRC